MNILFPLSFALCAAAVSIAGLHFHKRRDALLFKQSTRPFLLYALFIFIVFAFALPSLATRL